MQHFNFVNILFEVYIIVIVCLSSMFKEDYIYAISIWKETFACRVTDLLLLSGGWLTKSALCLVSLNQLIATKYALTQRHLTNKQIIALIAITWSASTTFNIFAVFGAPPSISISCHITSPPTMASKMRILTFHAIYLFIILTQTIIVSVLYYHLTTYVKESSYRVRSTRDLSALNRRLMNRTRCIVLVEWSTAVALSFLLGYSYFSSSELRIYFAFIVCCMHSIPHCVMHYVRPSLGRFLQNLWKQTKVDK